MAHSKNRFNQFANRLKQGSRQLLVMASLAPTVTWAQGLPTVDAPSQGGGGGLLKQLQGYLYDFGIVIGLVLCAVAFLLVGSSSLASFKEARERETWGKFAVTVVIGVVLIVTIIWLATEASTILSQ